MKIFGRSGGYYLFWCSALYLVIGMLDIFFIEADLSPQIQIAWLSVLVAPFVFPPWVRWFNLDINWDKKMFNLFGKKDKGNVVDFPKLVEPTEPKPEPKKEEPAKIFYRLGLTDNNRVSFQMGYSEITMNKAGCQQMIDQLEFFKGQLYDDNDTTPPDPDGGEPVPVPEQKAA